MKTIVIGIFITSGALYFFGHILLVWRVWSEFPDWARKNEIMTLREFSKLYPRHRVDSFSKHLKARAPEMMTLKHAELIRFFVLYGVWINFVIVALAFLVPWLGGSK